MHTVCGINIFALYTSYRNEVLTDKVFKWHSLFLKGRDESIIQDVLLWFPCAVSILQNIWNILNGNGYLRNINDSNFSLFPIKILVIKLYFYSTVCLQFIQLVTWCDIFKCANFFYFFFKPVHQNCMHNNK